MGKTLKTIEVAAYQNKDGLPSCADNFDTGEVCIFYRCQKFGTWETCVFAREGLKGLNEHLQRRDGGKGLLIPLKDCIIWGR